MIERIIDGKRRDIGGFEVRRVLPAGGRQMVGPFIFFDHIGPADFAPGKGIDVRPHPHIGLATVTYLFEGELMHRDSLGFHQAILPGDCNWMTAGRGIVHSERTRAEVRARGHRIHGIQSWVALPKTAERIDPAFVHHSHVSLPTVQRGDCTLRIIAGTAFGASSPVATASPTLYVDLNMPAGATLVVPDEHGERAAYVAEGTLSVAGSTIETGSMVVFDPGKSIELRATTDSRVMLLGGEAMDGPRYIWWNYVASSQDMIEQAKADWVAQKFGAVPGETEFIPLPEK